MKSVTNHVVSKINLSMYGNQGLASGKYKIYAMFTINKKSKVSNINVSFENEVISKDILKAVKSIKRMTPAYLDDKPVKVNYTLPIVFKIE